MPSGCYLTAIMNSIYNLVMLRFGAYECVEWNRHKLSRLRNDCFIAVTYGDDNVWTVHPDFRKEINFNSM